MSLLSNPTIKLLQLNNKPSHVSVAVVTALLVAALVWSEARYFLSPGYNFKFVPDADYETKLTINVDLTVAMPCDRKLGSFGHDIHAG